MPELRHEMTYRFRVRGPLAATEGAPGGTRAYWEIAEGTLTGARINARIAMPGGDWMGLSADRFGRPDVRVQLVTDDGAVILLHYTGLVERTVAFRWLNESLFIAEGRLAGPQEIEYRIYRVL